MTTSCDTQGVLATGILLGEKGELAIYQDSAQSESSPVAAAAVQMMLDYYARYGGTVIHRYFGGLSDIDGDGQVVAFITPAVPEGIAAFVWAGDLWSESDCYYSNRMELVYFDRDIVHSLASGNYFALGTIVHEVKHVSALHHQYRRESFDPAWIEEGGAPDRDGSGRPDRLGRQGGAGGRRRGHGPGLPRR